MFRKSKANLLTLNILLTSLLIFAGNLSGQNFTIKSYTTSDGLPHNNIRAIARDSSGFLWLGTWDGLSRFDGHEFRNYFHVPDDSTSIPFFSITELCVDRANNLWILTDTRQLVHYNRNTDNFQTLEAIDGIRFEEIHSISLSREGDLMILDKKNLIKRDSDKKVSKAIPLFRGNLNPFLNGVNVTHFSMIDDSEFWITGDTIREFVLSGYDKYILKKEYILLRTRPVHQIYFDIAEWSELYKSTTGNIWILSNNGIFRLDEAKGVFKEFTGEIPDNEFTGRPFFYWAERNNGIFIYRSEDQSLLHIPDHHTKWLLDIIPDGENTFWFSNTTSKGVAQGFSRIAFIPGNFRNTLFTAPDSTNPAIYSIVMDRDRNIWTGIRGYDHIVQSGVSGDTNQINFLTEESFAAGAYIRSMIPVKEGIWIGYIRNLLQFYDYKTGHFTRHHADANTFRAIAVNEDGNLYIGTNDLLLYNPSSGKTEILWKSQEQSGIFKIYPDTSGIVWAAMSNSGLLRYDLSTGEGHVIKVVTGTSNVEDIIPGKNGDLWLALLGKGVCRYSTVKGTFNYYTTAKGLSNNTTYGLLMDRHGRIWVSTNDGISIIVPESGHIRTFDETDGIAISEFNSGAKFISDAGEFIFGGMGGFVRFFPDSISLNEEQAGEHRLLLTSFEISGEIRALYRPLNECDTIILDRGENNFHLTFSSTDFINSQKQTFRYMLSGINRRWIETSSQNRNINYSNLKPGWFDLIIEAADQNGGWTVSRKITIRIKPLFYQTRTFRILMPLLLLFIVIFSIILYIRQLQQKERSKQDELKLQSLRSQMNPHFIFNSLNSINYFISNNDKLSANRYIADFSRLIRSILSNMGSNFIPLDNEINSIRDYLRIEHLRFGDKFDYSLETDEIKDMAETEVCPGIVQPFIENAIWHGVRPLENRKGFITIRFFPAGDEGLKCNIEDDGIGRTASLASKETNGSHKPKGISIISERLQITGKLRRTNYRLEISDLYPGKKETGTRVEVDIPAVTIKRDQHDKSSGSR